MDVLNPYIESGKLVVLSGQTEKAQCATPNWSAEESQKRMENLITSNGYGPESTRLDAVLCSNDSTAYGVQTVSYTHLTLPTNREGEFSVDVGTVKTKKEGSSRVTVQ